MSKIRKRGVKKNKYRIRRVGSWYHVDRSYLFFFWTKTLSGRFGNEKKFQDYKEARDWMIGRIKKDSTGYEVQIY